MFVFMVIYPYPVSVFPEISMRIGRMITGCPAMLQVPVFRQSRGSHHHRASNVSDSPLDTSNISVLGYLITNDIG